MNIRYKYDFLIGKLCGCHDLDTGDGEFVINKTAVGYMAFYFKHEIANITKVHSQTSKYFEVFIFEDVAPKIINAEMCA